MRLAAMFALLSLAQALSIAGTWSATINSPGGSFDQVFTSMTPEKPSPGRWSTAAREPFR